ncbi:MAG: helix-hairpin-helix domain-containing protein [Patescibacteria group bacterium]
MSNLELSRLLRAIAAALEIKYSKNPTNRFRVIAYERAADSVEHSTSEAKDLWDDNKLDSIPGVGKTIAQHLHDLFKTGKVKDWEEVFEGLPPAMFEIMQVPGIGPKRAYKISKELGISKAQGAIQKLIKAAEKGRIRKLEGMGEQSELQILETVKQVKEKSKRFPLPYAQTVADEVIEYMKKSKAVERIDTLGSLRRQVSTIGDVDISVASDKPKEVIKHFKNYPKKTKLIEAGTASAALFVGGGIHVDLMVQTPEAYGALLQHFTGSKDHNVALRTLAVKKGLSLSEYGISKQPDKSRSLRPGLKRDDNTLLFNSEEKFYQYLGLEWIPPELRENTGEIEAALKHKLPNLVEVNDLKGDLHLHSNFPPQTSHDSGAHTPNEMAKVAKHLGYEYIAFTEHNPKQTESKNKIMDDLKRKKELIEQIPTLRGGSRENRLQKVFNSLEVDIKPNGKLALPDLAFDLLDFLVVAIHSSFRGTREAQTSRILQALEYPKVKILAHPTGRMLGSREGIEINWPKVFEICKKKNIWLEINSWPERLDLPDTLVHEAINSGVKLVISTDSHSKDQMELIRYGVSVARRGWAKKGDIMNTLPYDKFAKVLESR